MRRNEYQMTGTPITVMTPDSERAARSPEPNSSIQKWSNA